MVAEQAAEEGFAVDVVGAAAASVADHRSSSGHCLGAGLITMIEM